MPAAASSSSAPSPSPEPAGLGGSVKERGTSLHPSVRAEAWVARGLTKVVGAVEVGIADLGGTVVVGGDLKARELTVRGALSVVGTVSVDGELGVHGSITAAAVRAGSVAATGSVRTDGGVQAERRLVVRGSFAATSVAASEAHLSGAVRVPGGLRAAEVELELAGGSELGTVVGRTVSIGGPEGGFLDRLLGRAPEAHVERVEGERVRLERVDVGSVFATEVRIGRDCHVTSVEAGHVEVHPSSRVGPSSRSPPPHGLRR